jgi:hypothetical protein
MASNNFKPQKFVDHEIVDSDGEMVGTIRVKPSGILWSPRDGKKWRGITLDNFASFMEENGKLQDK